MKSTIKLLLLIAITMFITGCGPKITNLQTISYDKKEYKKINTNGVKKSFALVNPQIKIVSDVSSLTAYILGKRMIYNAEILDCFLPQEMEKILLAKGFTIEGRYTSRNEMTYSEKKKTTAILYPVITLKIKETGTSQLVRNNPGAIIRSVGKLKFDVNVKLEMYEPLSNEKIWVKDISNVKVNDLDINYAAINIPTTKTTTISQYLPYTKKIDDMFKLIANKTLNTAYKYIEQEEFDALNEDIIKLKSIKRY